VAAGDPPGRDVLLIAPAYSYRTAAYAGAASRLGLSLTVASEGDHALVGGHAGGVHVRLGGGDALAHLIAIGRRQGWRAVLATDDATVELASEVACALGLPHNAPDAARLSRRKDLARARLAAAGLPVPEFRVLDLGRALPGQLAGLRYPCVVKPVALSGSRGVIRADDPAALVAACGRVAAILADTVDPEERVRLLVERFVPGPEVALEGLLDAGGLRVLALFDKPDPLDGPYFEETYYVTPSRLDPSLQALVARRVAEACRAYGLVQGPVHAELRLFEGDAWVLEVASRTIGGQCARLLRFGSGRGLEELILAQAVGLPLAPTPAADAAGVLMIPTPGPGMLRRVEGVLEAERVPYVEEVEISVREGYRLVPLPEGSAYLGFVFARAPTAALAEQALREAHARLRIVTAPYLSVAAG
jgi:biotin carboxylase